MNGTKPTHTIWAKPRTRDGSKVKAVKVASAWPNKFGGHNITFERPYGDRPGIAAIVLTDGTRIAVDSHFFDWRDEEANARHWAGKRQSRPQSDVDAKWDAEKDGDASGDGNDDIPFPF